METNNLAQKNAANFECINCDYKCFKKSDYNRHILTVKHKRLTETNNFAHFSAKNLSDYICLCGNSYKHASSLCKHKKTCEFIGKQTKKYTQSDLDDDKESQKIQELVITIMKEFMNSQKEIIKEQQNMMLEVIKNGTYNTTNNNNNNINSHNKTFNLQFFLNETCKNAMNLTDFIDSIKLELSDLIKIGEIGYVEGISNIITSNLEALDVTKRPIHCADKKREIIYIKDENKWEKDDDNKNKLRKAIKNVAYKNEKLLPEYKQKYPGCNFSASKYADQYSKIVIEAMGGAGNNDKEKEDKIIRNISKATILDKLELIK